MTTLLADWIELLVRWLHVIAGIGWIGSSFYFVALDLGLKRHGKLPDGVAGEAWQVHGGGFYRMQKYTVAPDELPPDLTWFKWEAYTTWLSGFTLLVLVYYLGAEIYLIDPGVMDLPAWAAVLISLISLALGWLIYDSLCKSRLGANDPKLGLVLYVVLILIALAYANLYSGRGAWLHMGALIGTIMTANVFFVIIPNQRIVVDELIAGKVPDGALGKAAKQRSLHNNYLTLPVIFAMISNHYPMVFDPAISWLVFAGVVAAGALIRQWFNMEHAGTRPYRWLWPSAGALIAGAALLTVMPRASLQGSAQDVAFADVQPIVAERCVACHASQPTFDGFEAPPAGLVLETPEAIKHAAEKIHAQVVVTQAMPPGNLTELTDEERAKLAAWLDAGAPLE